MAKVLKKLKKIASFETNLEAQQIWLLWQLKSTIDL